MVRLYDHPEVWIVYDAEDDGINDLESVNINCMYNQYDFLRLMKDAREILENEGYTYPLNVDNIEYNDYDSIQILVDWIEGFGIYNSRQEAYNDIIEEDSDNETILINSDT
mgnify:CR=1 FL=1